MNPPENRQQRRAREKSAAMAQKQISAAGRAAQLKQQGMALKGEGKEAQAVAPLMEALKLDSSFADVHFALGMIADTETGLRINMEMIIKPVADKKVLLHPYADIMAILRKNRQYEEAVICQDQICRLSPDDPLALMDLGFLLNRIGKTEQAT